MSRRSTPAPQRRNRLTKSLSVGDSLGRECLDDDGGDDNNDGDYDYDEHIGPSKENCCCSFSVRYFSLSKPKEESLDQDTLLVKVLEMCLGMITTFHIFYCRFSEKGSKVAVRLPPAF